MRLSIMAPISKPLDEREAEIRLLYLKPGEGEATITCTLCLGHLDNAKYKYEALSYAWGDPTKTPLSILLDGKNFAVRENLWWALWHLRDPEKTRKLWVDALCINQEDEAEKNYQVSQMGRIYQGATRVVAWIGREMNDSASDNGSNKLSAMEEAINFINIVYGDGDDVYYNRSEWSVNTYPQKFSNRSKTSHRYLTESDPGWASLLLVCKRTYWTRLWIIQELLLAREIVIQCSDHVLNWAAVDRFFSQTRPQSQLNPGDQPQRIEVVAELEESVPFKIHRQRMDRYTCAKEIVPIHTLFELFCAHRKAGCGKLYDRLFGLLGLCRRCCQEALRVDYNTPLSDLCRTFLEHYFQYHAGPITGSARSQNVSGLQEALLIFSSDLFGTQATPFLQVHVNQTPVDIASVACKFLGTIETAHFATDSLSGQEVAVAVGSLASFRAPQYRSSWKLPFFQFAKGRTVNNLDSPNVNLEFLTFASIREILASQSWQKAIHPWDGFYDANEAAMKEYSRLPRNGFLITAVGNVKAKDLVYRLDNQYCVVFRSACSSLSVVAIGFQPERTSLSCSELSTFTELSDKLYVDYNNLAGCCVLFDDGLTLQKHVAECYLRLVS